MNRDELLQVFPEPIKVLDHGFVRLVDVMGDDAAIAQAARVSYGGGASSASDDRGLIRYLMAHRHTSPFEMCEIKLHCKLPIFVARQWIRHRTASVNEVSGRYSVLPDEMYLPEPGVVATQSVTNKQGREAESDPELADDFIENLRYTQHEDRNGYDGAIKRGVARELARLHLSVGQYTEWYWKIDLHNLLHFLNLRMDGHAQWEIQQYAHAIARFVSAWVPVAYSAFLDYELFAVRLSDTEQTVLFKALSDELLEDGIAKLIARVAKVEQPGMTQRERTELVGKLLAFAGRSVA